tara:strand:+ start:340 stop:963 length:624 start_codon:yes stop_codon:yes gene_type:complete
MGNISANQNFDDTGKAVTYKVLNFRSINYGIGVIDSSQKAKQKFLGHRWGFTLESPPLLRSEAFEIMSGRYTGAGSTTVSPPVISNTSGTATGTVTVQLLSSTSPAYNYIKGSTTIPVAGGSGTLKKGDFIRFSDHTKIYQLTADTNLDGSSVDTISIFPALFQTLTATTVGYNSIDWTVSNTSDQIEISTNENGYFEYSIDFIEDV